MNMIDFDAKRVNELFKDSNMSELKEGITLRDINSVVGITPPKRVELHQQLQMAYDILANGNKPIVDTSTKPMKTLKEQMAENAANSTKAAEVPALPPLTTAPPVNHPLINNYELQNKIAELQAEIKGKDEVIDTLTKERDEVINQQYELEKHHVEKYKELNNKYEELKESKPNTSVPSVVENISDDLMEYMRDKLVRMEQKEALLNQEIGKLKGMLGI